MKPTLDGPSCTPLKRQAPFSRSAKWLCVALALLVAVSCNNPSRGRTTQPTRPHNPPREQPSSPTRPPTKPEVADVPAPTKPETTDPSTDPKQVDTPAKLPRLSLMMPFFGDNFAGSGNRVLPENAIWGLQYYAGLRLALEDLERDGIRADVHIFDSKGDAGVSQRLISDVDLRTSDAVIAPYLTDAVRSVVDAAQARGIPLIVPFSAAPDLATDFPQLLQLNPGLPTHLDALAVYLHDTYSPDQVVLVGLPTGEQNGAVAYLKNRQRVLNPSGAGWRTWRLESSDDNMSGLNWEGKFAEGKETVFVFPISNRPELINGFMSQLRIRRKGSKTILAGMPQWADMPQLDPTMLETHQVVVTTGPMIDWEDYDVHEFVDRYALAYGTIPELPAFLGYDAAQYSLRLITKWGIKWTEHLPTTYDGLVSRYLMRARYNGEATGAAAERRASHYENTDVRLLFFREGGFRPAPGQ